MMRYSNVPLLKVMQLPLFPPCSLIADAAMQLHHAAPAELDGKQVLDFYWTDPIDAIKRFVAKRQYTDKLYTTFQPGT
jgi:hypothetical protein